MKIEKLSSSFTGINYLGTKKVEQKDFAILNGK